MAAKPPAVQKQTGSALVSWKDKLSQYASADAATADASGIGGGFKIAAKKGKLFYDGQPVAGNALDVIVVDSVMENAYYDTEFDPDNPRSPVCFAFGRDEADMSPHPDSKEPQHDKCKGCAHNEFGSAAKGRGKACKNIRRLALLPAKPLEAEVLEKAELAFMRTTVTSAPIFNTYVKRLKNTYSLPTMAFVTQLGCVDDDKTQFKLTFQDMARLDSDDDIMAAIVKRREQAEEEIGFPYAPPADDEPKPKGKGARKY